MSTSKRAYVAKCSSELGWGGASASPDSTFRQHKCNSGPGLVFHLLELGCILLASTQGPSAMLFSPAHSPRLGSLPLQSCKHTCRLLPALWETIMWRLHKAERPDNSRVFGKFSPCSSGFFASPAHLWASLNSLLC